MCVCVCVCVYVCVCNVRISYDFCFLLSDAEVKIHPGDTDFPASLRPRGSLGGGAIAASNPSNRSSIQPLLAGDQPIDLGKC